MAGKRLLVLAFILHVAHSNVVSEEGYFSHGKRSLCTCPDSSLSMTYKCTVMGGLGTIWTGSIISELCEDSDGEIFLLHNRFDSDIYLNKSITCGNGTIVVQSIRVENNSFTSQLTVTVSSDILGDSIVCAHSHNGTTNIIGNTTIIESHTIDKVYINAIDIGLKQLEFAWSPVAPDCPVIHYNIQASNCGSCPTTTNHTAATCTNVPISGSMCVFTIEPVVCGYVKGNPSYSITISSTEIFRGTHPNRAYAVSLSFLIVGVACLVISVSVIAVCCCLYVMKKQTIKPSSRSKTMINYNMISIQNDCNTTQNENSDTCEYSELNEIPLDLKSLLKKLQGQVSKQWYQFGLGLGLPMDVLEGFNLYSEEDCLVEVLDYWLKHHPTQPTWQEITDAQSKIESFNTTKDSGSVKIVEKDATVSDIPPPKPPRRSSSVTARNSTAPLSTESKNDCEHEYECVP